MTPVVVAYLWQFILAEQGPANTILRTLGLGTWLNHGSGKPERLSPLSS